MSLSLKPDHLKRYKDLASVFVKYGRSDLVRTSAVQDAMAELDPVAAPTTAPGAEELANDLERLGPTFVKLGQLLSTRADLLPPPYLDALSRLQDDVEPFAFAEAEQIIASELNVRLSKAFQELDPVPLAAASLGQVHRAILRNGRAVAVKVQRPGIRERVMSDLEVLREVADFIEKHTELGRQHGMVRMFDEFQRTLVRELDYRLEARNLDLIADNLNEFHRIIVPRPVRDYTTSRVLTMDYVQGRKITALAPVARLDVDGALLAEELFRAYLKQVLADGIFHADPHPGNVFITTDGRLALLDLGMVSHITPAMQEKLMQLLLATGDARGEEAADVLLQIGEKHAEVNATEFRRQISALVVQHSVAALNEIRVGRCMLEMTRVSGVNGIGVPRELTLLGKTLLNLDEVARTLDPSFDPNSSIRRNSAELMQRRMFKSLSTGNVFASALEMKDFMQRLPARVNRLLDAVVENDFKVKVDVVDLSELLDGLQKVANRITAGLVLAALIVGAVMLMRVETTFRIFGYPGLAMLLFLAAAAGGFWLVGSIFLHDRHVPPRTKI